MTLPARRQRVGGLAEPVVTAWTRNPLAQFDDLFNWCMAPPPAM